MMHEYLVDNDNELAVIIEDTFKTQLMQRGYTLWDDFISPLFISLINVNSDVIGAKDELFSLAPLVRDAMNAARIVLLNIGEQRNGRLARLSPGEEGASPRGGARSSYVGSDTDVRYRELLSGLAVIECGLKDINALGIDRCSSSYRQMMDVIEGWYEQVSELHSAPTTEHRTEHSMQAV